MQLPAAWEAHDRAIRPYIWSHRAISWLSKLAFLTFVVWMVSENRWLALSDMVTTRVGTDGVIATLLYFGMLGAISQILGLPFDYAHFKVERRFHLSKQSAASWAWDWLKGIAIGIVLGGIILSGLYWIYTRGGSFWWIYTFIAFLMFSVLLAQLAPVIFIPLFFKMAPMEDSPLKARLLGLCHRFKIPVKEIYHLGLGEKTEKGNAAFVGLGRTKRIIIGDTLYQKYSADEVEAVFAHELGHQVHNDLWKSIGIGSATALFCFGAAACGLPDLVAWAGATGVATHLLLFMVSISLLQIPFGFIHTCFSRWRERLADRFAEKTIGIPKPLADALEKLTFQNKGQFRPHPIIEALTYSHPAPWRRIVALRDQAR